MSTVKKTLGARFPATGGEPARGADLRLASLADSLVVSAGAAPAASLAAAARTAAGWLVYTGAAGVRSSRHPEPIGPGTIFDLASVTKPFVAAAAARLARAGRVDLAAPVEQLVEETRGTPTGPWSLEALLSHRAGLEAHRALYAPLVAGRSVDGRAALREAAEARRAECRGAPPPQGFPPLYSDLGYLLAGEALARAAGQPLDDLLQAEVIAPLGLAVASARQWKQRDADAFSTVAPTEVVEFRGGELVGVVHDDNAWAVAGDGSAGHAGLFGTAEGVARFGVAMIDALAGRDASWLSREEALTLVRPRPGGSLRCGFDGKSKAGSSAGALLSRRAFGHLGFTGTSLWCDPSADLVIVALTNRVSPTRENIAIRAVRPRLHDALVEAARRAARDL